MSARPYVPVLFLTLAALAVVACSGPTVAPTAVQPVGAVDVTAAVTASASGVVSTSTAVTDPSPVAADSEDETPATEGARTPVTATLSADTGRPVGESSEPPRPISAITNTLTYADETLGYAIDYPASWFVDAAPGTIVTLTSFDPDAAGAAGLRPGDSKIEIVPDMSQVTSTLDDLVARGRQTGLNMREQEVELAGGIPAVLMFGNSVILGGDTGLLVAVVAGNGLRVQGYGDLTDFASIASSLRAAGQGSAP